MSRVYGREGGRKEGRGARIFIIFQVMKLCFCFVQLVSFQEFYAAGTYIIRQGGRGDSFFIISSGRVQVTQRLPGTVKRLSISNPCAGGGGGGEGKGKGIEKNKMLVKENIKTESRSKWIDIWSAGLRSRLTSGFSHRGWKGGGGGGASS